ncbi:hypothetical protein FUAX_40750 (plasmid) [Fulvitalea axinellae]|uniref:Uncharacterized protein n=1 Tax=Fulvitalea axinellae TaxID=1182444 RepID=A0AAU9CFB1_9BACT|nr:hypothetical protein FUAX_32910 [Fulvitalea axinellae]BDD11643.1 hypothetical protein FUAX_40750 [Fulvitalea axinellae]
MRRSRNAIKSFFETGDTPSREDFADFIDSVFFHNEDTLTASKISDLSEALTPYALKDEIRLKPGLSFAVADLSARDAIPSYLRAWDQEIRVVSEGKSFRLTEGKASGDLADNGNWSALPAEFTDTQVSRLLAGVYINATASISRNRAVIEKGLTADTNINVSWNVSAGDDNITEVTVAGIDGTPGNSGNRTVGLRDSWTFTLRAKRTASDGTPKGDLVKSAGVSAVVPVFYGVSAESTYPEADPYGTGFTKLVQTGRTVPRQSFSPNNQYVWFISTRSGMTVYDENNLAQSGFTETEIDLRLPDGTTEKAYAYVSKTPKTVTGFGYDLRL